MTDIIKLLSVEEYYRYKSKIPPIATTAWWLRTPASRKHRVAVVDLLGNVEERRGAKVDNMIGAVRPAINYKRLGGVIDCDDGRTIWALGTTWIILDGEWAIAEVPIGFEMFDYDSTCYAESHIRAWLNIWLVRRLRTATT